MQSRRSSKIKLSCKGEQPAQNANKVTDYSAGAITFFFFSLSTAKRRSFSDSRRETGRAKQLSRRKSISNSKQSAYMQTSRISWQWNVHLANFSREMSRGHLCGSRKVTRSKFFELCISKKQKKKKIGHSSKVATV